MLDLVEVLNDNANRSSGLGFRPQWNDASNCDDHRATRADGHRFLVFRPVVSRRTPARSQTCAGCVNLPAPKPAPKSAIADLGRVDFQSRVNPRKNPTDFGETRDRWGFCLRDQASFFSSALAQPLAAISRSPAIAANRCAGF